MPHVNHNIHFLGKTNMRDGRSEGLSSSHLHVQQRADSSILLLAAKVNGVKISLLKG